MTAMMVAQEIALMQVPLFPLSNVVLIPRALMPLHIFEPRYRRMVADLLDGRGQLIIATLLPGSGATRPDEEDPAPPVHPIAGLGQLESYQKLPDGRFVILVRGLARVRIAEQPRTITPYRVVSYQPADEIPASDVEASELESALRAAIAERGGAKLSIPQGVSLSQLVDILLLQLKLPAAHLSELFGLTAVALRARRALDAHRGKPN